MTVIAYRDGIMAADSASFWGDTATYNAAKVGIVGPYLVGTCGVHAIGERFKAWLRDGKQEPQPDFKGSELGAIVIGLDGLLKYWDEHMWPSPINEPYAAIGSGMDFALAAMDAGADAISAVEIAIHRHCKSGGEVMSLTLADLRRAQTKAA